MAALFDDRDKDQALHGAGRRLAMLSLLLFSAMGVLDSSLITIALPTIARELNVPASASVWIVTAYQLAGAMTMLAFSALGARLGFARVFLGGVAAFGAAALGCAFAGSLPLLVVLRFVQGLGSAAAMCVTAALLRVIFPPGLLGSALGINALVVASAMAVGPTLGGFIVGHLPWRWLFALDVPFGAASLWLGLRVLPRGEAVGPGGAGFDLTGAALSALAIACLVLAADRLAHPAGQAVGATLLVAAAVGAWLFMRSQRRARAPLLPPGIFRNRRFTLASVTSVAAFVGQGIALITLPFLFQGAFGYSPLASGLLFTPMPAAIMVAAPLAGRLADRWGAPPMASAGLLVLACGLALLALLDPATASATDIGLRIAVCGLGFGFFQTPNNREFISSVDRSMLGSASGMLSVCRTIGQTLGATAVSIALALQAGGSAAGHGLAAAQHACLWGASASVALAFGLSALRLSPLTRRTP